MKRPTVNKLVQNAKKEVGRNRFENIEDSFRDYAEKEILRMKLQESINRMWQFGGRTLLTVNDRKTERWLKDRIRIVKELGIYGSDHDASFD